MNFFVLALRNLSRNPRRTMITVSSTALAAATMIVYGALMDGMMIKLKDNITSIETGDIQIHHPLYREDASLYHLIVNPNQIIKRLDALGMLSSSRVYTFSLVASDETSLGAQIRGVDPIMEKRVSTIAQMLATGEWLDAQDKNVAVIGKKVASQLGVGVGDELIVLGQATDGSLVSELLNVKGVLKGVSSAIDRTGVFVSEDYFKTIFLLNEGVHEIAISLAKSDEPLLQATNKLQSTFPNLMVENWRQLLPVVAEMLDMSDVSMAILFSIIYVALALVLINSLLMSVFERIRELGILKALGLRPASIIQLILFESAIQTVIASVFAIVIGTAFGLWLETNPIDLTKFAGSFEFSGMAMEPYWYSQLSIKRVVEPLIFLFVIIFIASLIPAIKAARIEPVKAIYHR